MTNHKINLLYILVALCILCLWIHNNKIRALDTNQGTLINIATENAEQQTQMIEVLLRLNSLTTQLAALHGAEAEIPKQPFYTNKEPM